MKIKNTTTIKDSSGKEHVVCKGKLVLIKTDKNPTERGQLIIFNGAAYNPFKRKLYELAVCVFPDADVNVGHWKVVEPIIISETEFIDLHDPYFDENEKRLEREAMNTEINKFGNLDKEGRRFFKVLALPESFSPALLKHIASNTTLENNEHSLVFTIRTPLKDGDEVFVECANSFPEPIYKKDNKSKDYCMNAFLIDKEWDEYNDNFRIKLSNNHVTLFPEPDKLDVVNIEMGIGGLATIDNAGFKTLRNPSCKFETIEAPVGSLVVTPDQLKESNWDELETILSNPDKTFGTKMAMIRERYYPPVKKDFNR